MVEYRPAMPSQKFIYAKLVKPELLSILGVFDSAKRIARKDIRRRREEREREERKRGLALSRTTKGESRVGFAAHF